MEFFIHRILVDHEMAAVDRIQAGEENITSEFDYNKVVGQEKTGNPTAASSKFREYREWALTVPHRSEWYVGQLLERLDSVGKRLEDPIKLVTEADDFFFNANGRRKIHSLDETTTEVARLMEQGMYREYVDQRRLFTIPTLEFVDGIANLIQNGQYKRLLEAGAADGGLSVYLRFRHQLSCLHVIDDGWYGGKYKREFPNVHKSVPEKIKASIKNLLATEEEAARERENRYLRKVEDQNLRHTRGRPVSSIVEKMTLAEGLKKYLPDFVFASFLVSIAAGGEADAEILRAESVQQFLWIGEDSKRKTSSENLWKEPGWIQTDRPDLAKLIFTQEDRYLARHNSSNTLYETPVAFFDGMTPAEIREEMAIKKIQKAKVVLFSRQNPS